MFSKSIREIADLAKKLGGKKLAEIVLSFIFLILILVLSFENLVLHGLELYYLGQYAKNDTLGNAIIAGIFFLFLSLLFIYLPPELEKWRKRTEKEADARTLISKQNKQIEKGTDAETFTNKKAKKKPSGNGRNIF